jgi:hypothetical protein
MANLDFAKERPVGRPGLQRGAVPTQVGGLLWCGCYKHVAPLGLREGLFCWCYQYVAPLGAYEVFPRSPLLHFCQ